MSTPQTIAESLWRYRLLGEEFGPVPLAALRELLAGGDLSAGDEVAPVGGDWRAASAVAELTPPAGDEAELAPLDDDLAALLEQAGQVDHAATAEHVVVDSWYARILGTELGPLEWDQLGVMASQGELSAADEVRRGTGGAWQRAGDIVGLFGGINSSSPANSAAGASPPLQRWFRELPGGAVGTVTWAELLSLAATGQLTPRDRIRESAAGPWLRAATLPGLFTEQERARTWAGQAEHAVEHAPVPEQMHLPALTAAVVESPPPAPAAAATPPAAPVEPPDRWTQFFDDAEARDRKRHKRNHPTEPAPKPQSPSKPLTGEVHLAAPPVHVPSAHTPPAAGSAALRPHTPPPPAAVPKPAPAFVAPPKPKRSAQLPSFNFSGLLDKFKGGGEGGGMGPKLLIPLVIGGLVLAWKFMPSLGGYAGATDYPVLAGYWQRALQLQEAKGTAADWSALQSEATPVIDEMQSRLASVVQSYGKDAPVAQRILWMVDRDTGPTSASGYLRKILAAGPAALPADFTNGTAVMSEAGGFLMPQ